MKSKGPRCVPAAAVLAYISVCGIHGWSEPRESGNGATRLEGTSEPSSAQRSSEVASKRQGFADLPMQFEENRGQADPSVRFISRGSGYTLFLTANEAIVVLSRQEPTTEERMERSPRRRRGSAPNAMQTSVVKMKLLGANSVSQTTGTNQLVGSVNYLIGQEAKNWHTGIPTYSAVQYSEIYPGTNLVYYGNGGQLEYDFVLTPGADPRHVALSFEGTKRAVIDRAGNLAMDTEAGKLTLLKPSIYQTIAGEKKPIRGAYVLRQDRTIGVEVGKYDASKSLVIDPVLAYSSILGGSASEFANGVVADFDGNVYLAGATTSIDFSTTDNSISTASSGHCLAFVTKLDPAGTTALYSTYLGGTAGDNACYSGDYALGLAVDGQGHAYVVGPTVSQNFPVTSNAFQSVLGAGASSNGFLAKLSTDGRSLQYSTYLGGENNDGAYSVAVDGNENAYVGGWSSSPNFPVTPNAFQANLLSSASWGNGFLSRIDTRKSGASSLIYSSLLGGSSEWGDAVSSVAIDANQNAYLTGWTASADFPVTASSAFQPSASIQYWCGFVSRIDTSKSGQSSLRYSSYLCGSSSDWAWRIALDTELNAYVVGFAGSTDFPTTEGGLINHPGNGFVTKVNTYDSASASLVYSRLLGGANSLHPVSESWNYADALAVDGRGNAYVGGWTVCSDFPITPDAIQTTLKSNAGNGFMTILGPDGSSILYSTYWGGSGTRSFGDQVYDLTLDRNANIYLVGQTDSNDLPTTTVASHLSVDGPNDIFVAKFSALPFPQISSLSPSTGSPGAVISIAGSNFGDTTGTVTVGGVEAIVQAWSATSIAVQIPPSLGAGAASVIVNTLTETSNSVPFNVEELTISGLLPTSIAVGGETKIVGTGFGETQGSSSVSFNGKIASTISWSGTQIVAVLPENATTGSLSVMVDGTASNPVGFTVVKPPTIAVSVAPAPNANGWNDSPALVTFSCSAQSLPIASCASPQTATGEGANQIVQGTTTDTAGNTSSATVTVNIDRTAPKLLIPWSSEDVVISSRVFTLHGEVSDSLSGISGVTCNGAAATIRNSSFFCSVYRRSGSNLVTVRAIDRAGNIAALNLRARYRTFQRQQSRPKIDRR
jgi:IPT/TIG domain/Beta-propeller repeat